MPFDRNSFLSRWRAALDEAGKRRPNSLFPCWEGPAAYNDLKRTGLLNFVQFREDGIRYKGERDWRSRQMLGEFEAAVRIYEADVNELLGSHQAPSATDELSSVARALALLAGGKHGRKLKTAATKLLGLVEDEIESQIATNQRERDAAFFDGLPGISTALKELPLRPPTRHYDLDARFQVKLGFLFNFYLRGYAEEARDISFRTISRLVVVFYIASGLAEYVPGPLTQRQIKTLRSEEKDRATIRVPAVDLNLRRARLNEFGRGISSKKGRKKGVAEVGAEG